jgi:hypothetical protein
MRSLLRLSRAELLDFAPRFLAEARARFPAAGVAAAADRAQGALDALLSRLSEQARVAAEREQVVAAALEAEAGLDRRARALAQALEAHAELGVPEAGPLSRALFPKGAAALTRASGRAQVGEYLQLADGLRSSAGQPGLAPVAGAAAALEAELRAFSAALTDKDGHHRGVAEAVAEAREGSAALVAALEGVDFAVAAAEGGLKGPGRAALWEVAGSGLSG